MVKEIKLYLLIVVLMILVFAIIVSHVRISKTNTKCKKLQKHLLYQQSILDKHKRLLDENLNLLPKDISKTLQNDTTLQKPPEILEDDNSENILELNTPAVQNQVNPTSTGNPRRDNPMSTILPLVTSMMTMMNQPDTVTNVMIEPSLPMQNSGSVIEEIDYEKQEEEKRMLEVIKEEMNELQVRSDDKESTDNIEVVEEKVTEVPGIAVQ